MASDYCFYMNNVGGFIENTKSMSQPIYNTMFYSNPYIPYIHITCPFLGFYSSISITNTATDLTGTIVPFAFSSLYSGAENGFTRMKFPFHYSFKNTYVDVTLSPLSQCGDMTALLGIPWASRFNNNYT